MKSFKELLEKSGINSYKSVSKDGEMTFDLNKIASSPWEKKELETVLKKYNPKIIKDILYIPKEFQDDSGLMKIFTKLKFKT